MNSRPSLLPTRWLAVPVLAVVVLVAAGFVFEAASRTEPPTRVMVVVNLPGDRDVARVPHTAAGATDGALVARATAAARRADAAPGVEAQVRVTRTPTEQLSVTHLFAATGYDAVVGVGLDRAIAVAPVASRFPDTRFVLVPEAELASAVAAASR